MSDEKKRKIVCLGDSLTWGFPYGPTYSWVHLVSQRTGLNMINRGVNGNCTEDMLRRFSRDVVSAQPDHVILLGGTNDIIIRESFPRIIYNLEALVEEAVKHNIAPIIGLPIPLGDREAEVRLARVRDWINNYAAQKNFSVIDFVNCFYKTSESGEAELRWDLMLDWAHPSIEGYKAMADQVDVKELGLLSDKIDK